MEGKLALVIFSALPGCYIIGATEMGWWSEEDTPHGNRSAEQALPMLDPEDPAVLVLLLLPGSKVRSLIMSAISNLPSDADPGLSSMEKPPQSGERVLPRFNVDLFSTDDLETVLRLRDRSTPILVLEQAEAEHHGGGSAARGAEETREAQANGQDLLSTVLAAAGNEEAAPAQPDDPDLVPLSPRETEILALLAQGASNQLISQSLSISLNTVKTHLKNVMRKLNTSNRQQAALVGKLIFYKSSSD